jgi:hypothetical protein
MSVAGTDRPPTALLAIASSADGGDDRSLIALPGRVACERSVHGGACDAEQVAEFGGAVFARLRNPTRCASWRGLSLGCLPRNRPLAFAIFIPSRVRSRMRSASIMWTPRSPQGLSPRRRPRGSPVVSPSGDHVVGGVHGHPARRGLEAASEFEFGFEEVRLQPVHRVGVQPVLTQRLCRRAGQRDLGGVVSVEGVLVLLFPGRVGQAGIEDRHVRGAMP